MRKRCKTEKEKHPLYNSWAWQSRKSQLCCEWKADFYAFVEAVGQRPENHTLRRVDSSKPMGPDNFHWKKSTLSKDKAAYQREWRAANPRKARDNEMRSRYGISMQQYEGMLETQGGVCRICAEPEKHNPSLAIDHCHITGTVRGLLCTLCNRGIGLLQDNPDLCIKAASYLDQNQAVGA